MEEGSIMEDEREEEVWGEEAISFWVRINYCWSYFGHVLVRIIDRFRSSDCPVAGVGA